MFTNKDYILAIAKEGSFSRAAQALYISQPSLSASVKRIEDKISVPLFDRSTNPVSLTEAGEKYVRYALEIQGKEREFEKYISDYTNLLTGHVTIGGSSLFSSFMLPSMIAEFNKRYPSVKFEIFEDSTKNLMEKLMLGAVDIIIDNAIIKNDSINSTVYMREMLLLAVPKSFEINEKLKDYRLTGDDIAKNKHYAPGCSVKLKDFAKHPFILLNPENDTGKRANELFKKHGIDPKVIFCLDQQVTAFNASCTGMGISFVSDTLIRHINSAPALYYYKLSDGEAVRSIYFYTKNNRYLSNACKKFIESYGV